MPNEMLLTEEEKKEIARKWGNERMKILAIGGTKKIDGKVRLAVPDPLPDDAIIFFVRAEDAEKIKKLIEGVKGE